MKNHLPIRFSECTPIIIFIIFGMFFGAQSSSAQTFPIPGFTLPAGEIIYITYDADVNASIADTVCEIVNQSTVTATNPMVTLLTDDPAFPGMMDPTITPVAQPAQITLCPNDTTVTASLDSCGRSMTFVAEGLGCPDVTISFEVEDIPITFPYFFPVGMTTVVVIAEADTLPPDTCMFVVTVTDDQDPEVTCNNLSLQLDVNGMASFIIDDITSGIDDNCAVDTVTINGPNTFTCDDADSTFTLTVTVTDENGNTATCISMVTILDDTNPCCAPPVAICQDITVAADETGIAVVPPDSLDNGSIIDCGLDFFSASPAILPCPSANPTVVTLIVTDLNGNTGTCTAFVTVIDTLPPAITCPADMTVDCTESTDPSNTGFATATDCDNNPVITFDDVTLGGVCPQEYVITRTWTATDSLGQSSTCEQIITVDDSTPPVITCPGDITVECPGSTHPDAIGFASASDDCDADPAVTWDDVTIAGGCVDDFTINRTWTATDTCGNVSTCLQVITFENTTAPILFCPANLSVSCASQVPPADPETIGLFDLCDGGGITVTHVSDITTNQTCANRYTLTRTYRATDGCGNSATCAQTITVNDVIVPMITCPADITVECPGSTLPASTGFATGTDNCSQTPVITFSDVTVDGSCGEEFTITRTWTATDACGNTATCTQFISFENNIAPILFCPENTTVSCATQVPPVNTGSVGLFDLCPGGGIVVTHVSDITTNQTCANRYTLTRTYRATDGCGNSATCSQTITVNDVTPPAIMCPPNSTVSCATAVPPVDLMAPVTSDNCGGTVTVTHVSDVTVNQTCVNRYTLNRTYRATDVCGNSATCLQTITVNDITPPTITCPANTTVSCFIEVPPVNLMAPITSDNCGGTVTLSHVSDVTVGQTCPNRYTLNRTYRATDVCGNSSTCIQTITVNDITVPTITCPANTTVSCFSEVPAVNLMAPITSDNCGGTVTVTHVSDITVGQTCPNRYRLNRTYRATDACGNSATCAQTITVNDQTVPMLTCPANISVECFTDVPAPNISLVTATDNCGGVPVISFVSDVTTNQTCANRYVLVRTYRATDACGNSNTCNQTITVFDDTPPTITCPLALTVQCFSLVPAPNTGLVTANDNCTGGAPTVTFVSDVTINQTCPNRYTLNRTYRATDVCGNTADCVQTITVLDDTPPMLTCPAPVSVSCFSQVPAVNTASVTTTDNCTGPAPTVSHVSDVTTNQTCVNRYTLTRTYRATDACGNSATCTQTITVNDITPPSITCPANVTVQCFSTVPPVNTGTVVTSDNCTGPAPVVTHVIDVTTNQTCVNRYTLTRTYRSTDACGNSATCNQVITVNDITPPSITCPANLTVQCHNQVPAVNTGSVITSDNCTGPAPVVTHVSDVTTNQTCLNRYILNRTYRSTDACGNSATCVQIITVFDNTPPMITFTHPLLQGVPNGGTIEIQCFGQDPNWDPPVFNEASVSVSDNCQGAVTTSFSDVVLDSGDCPGDGYISRSRLTWTATDVCGNSRTAFVIVELVDEIPPVIFGVPDDITVDCDEIPEPPLLMSITATDECNCACVIEYEQVGPFPGCQNGQVVVRSWLARDDCGNETIETQNITLIDNIVPVIQLTPPELAGASDGAVFEYTCNEGGIPDFFDDLNVGSASSPVTCGGAPIMTFEEDISIARNCRSAGFIEQRIFEWTATDACGNVTTLTITVELIDDESPVLFGVPDMVCAGDPSLDLVEAFDNCGNGNFIFWDVPIANPCGTGTALRRTYEGFDPCGNTVRDTAIIIPDDHIPPVMGFTHPDLEGLGNGEVLKVDCQANGDLFTGFGIDDVRAEDDCPEGLTISFEERLLSTGDCTDGGVMASLELSWVATDMCGNSTELTALINVMDETAPVFVNVFGEVSIDCNDALPSINATDNCGQVEISVKDSIVGGDCEFEYDVIRTITASDPCGNTNTRTQIVHVGGSGPEIEGVVAELCDDLSIPDVTAFDPCSGRAVEVTMEEVELNIPCKEGKVIQRTWSATDACGNVSQEVQLIYINDQTPPEIMVPTNSVIRRFLDNPENLAFLSQDEIIEALNDLDDASVFVQDDCDQVIVPEFALDVIYSTDCVADGYLERRTYTWEASDACGNSVVITFTVDIMDDIPPALSGIPADDTIICQDLSAPPSIIVEDHAQPVDIDYAQVIDPAENPGEFEVTRTWTVTDACDNVSTAEQSITWIPDTFLDCGILLPGNIDCNTHGVVIGSSSTGGLGELTYEWEIEGEKCFIQSGQGTPEITIYVGFSEVNITLTMTDAFGCTAVCQATLDCFFTFDNLLDNNSQANNPFADPAPRPESGEYLREINLWPNPASGTVNLSFESLTEDKVTFTFMNFLGQVILDDDITVHKGYNSRRIDVTKIPEGSYWLQVKTEKERHEKIVVIMRKE